jgi:hypothetical protein
MQYKNGYLRDFTGGSGIWLTENRAIAENLIAVTATRRKSDPHFSPWKRWLICGYGTHDQIWIRGVELDIRRTKWKNKR